MKMHRRSVLQQIGCGMLALGLDRSSFAEKRSQDHHPVNLPRSTPESQGVSSGSILNFLAAAEQAKHELHSVMLLRHGCVVAEGWWAPYRADAVHSLYSLSKSFTATAVGFAVMAGALRLSDRVISFFPDQLPNEITSNLATLTVEHLLTMSVGHSIEPSGRMTREDDWVRAFLAVPITYEPGTRFLYSSGASYMLSAIVQKVTSQRMLDYLQLQLFGALGISGARWECCPRGINTGGWGLSMTTESLAKFGQFYLQEGVWNDTRLLSAEWIRTATRSHIRLALDSENPRTRADTRVTSLSLDRAIDWDQGYGYHFWRCRYGAFRGDGALGQLCIIMPAQDAILVTTARTGAIQGLLNLVWEHLLPGARERSLPADTRTNLQLNRKLKSLMLQPPSGVSTPVGVKAYEEFDLDPNELGAKRASLTFREKLCRFALELADGTVESRCAIGIWLDGITNMPGAPPGLRETRDTKLVKVAAAGAWQDGQTFHIQLRYYETPHYDVVTCRFDSDEITIEFTNDIIETHSAPNRFRRRVLRGRALHRA